MTIVYVVTSCGYSDYRMEAIYDNRAAAVEHVERDKALRRYGGCRVEEYELFSVPRETVLLHVVMSTIDFNGKLMSSSESSYAMYADEAPRRVRSHMDQRLDGSAIIRTEGVDGDQVRKSHNDKVARVRTERQGL